MNKVIKSINLHRIMFMNKTLLFFSGILLLILSSCSEKRGTSEQALREVGGDLKNSHMRGVEIGDNKEAVKTKEKNKPIEETPTSLLYRQQISRADSSYYEIVYNFDELGLFEIQADVFLQDPAVSKEFFDQIMEKFNEKYGAPSGDGGIVGWLTKTKKNTSLEITLSNEGIEYIRPFISINFIEPLEEGGGI
jgi:hypothetical protein